MDPSTHTLDDQEARRWLAILRNGRPDEKARARSRLAEIFETRGMVCEAVELLVANAREGYRDAELFQSLARMYRQQGDEYLAASAALEATRLSGRQPSVHADVGQSPKQRTGADASRLDTDPQDAVPKPSHVQDPGMPPAWRLPLRFAGWITVLATLVAAGAVASEHSPSAALYLASAVALGLLLTGSGAARQLVRVPHGPLADGALLFIWLLALLAAGALLPRPFTMARPADPPTEVSTPAAVSTPSPAPSASPAP